VHLPHLTPFSRQPLVFLTCGTQDRRTALANEPAHQVLRGVWTRSAASHDWYVGRYVLMPDHVHLFARPGIAASPLARWIKMWKSVSSRQLAPPHHGAARLWQRDYFDHFLRSAAAYEDKWLYVLENPVRRGYCREAKEWPFSGEIHRIEY